jgi:hypothetical protein
MWLGLYLGPRLLSAMGYLFYSDGTVLVQMAVCEPSRGGRVALDAIIGLCRSMWSGRRVLWFSEIANRKMARVFKGVGASPVAAMWETVA